LLVRLKGSDRFGDTDWALVVYTPDNAPVRARMLNASSVKPLQIEFKGKRFEEYQASLKDEVTLKQFLDATKELTEAERMSAMTQEERDHEGVKKALAKEQAAAPKMLAGLVALKIKAHDSFIEAVKTVLAEENKAVLGKLTGEKNEELAGEVLSDIEKVSSLKGEKLPAETPCYVLMKPAADRLCLISWLPEFTPVKLRMKCSTFKASVIDQIKELAPDISSIVQAEVTCEDDLEDNLSDEKKTSGGDGGGYAPAAAPKFRPPVGGFALPGMGGGGKPPPGAVRMPGM